MCNTGSNLKFRRLEVRTYERFTRWLPIQQTNFDLD